MSRLVLLRCLAVLVVFSTSAVSSVAGEGEASPSTDEQSQVQQMVDELRPIVARLRGLEWKQEVRAELLSRDELRAFLQKQLEEDVTPEEMKRDDRIVRRLGLIRPDEDIVSMQMLMLRELVAGAYDPKTKRLYVIEGFTGEAQKPTLVHELIHALDDQHYDLLGMEEPYRDNDPDRQFAIRCLFEGSAEWARRAYQDMDIEAARTYYAQLEKNTSARAGQKHVMSTVPTHLLLATLLHYRAGPNFIRNAVGADFPAGMKRLFDDPPTSQEQILHPYKWLGAARDHPRTVRWGADFAAVAGPGWTQLDEHSVGELDLAVFLDYFLGDKNGRLNRATMGQGRFVSRMASRAARGWDAGRVRYLDSPTGHIVVVGAYAFDSTKDAAEAADILGAALRRASGDAWHGKGWERAEQPDVRSYDFEGKHGPGRILLRGREVLLLEGVRETPFDPLWNAVAQTTFERHEADRGDDPEDPFAACVVVDRYRGLGLVVPEGWTAESSSRSPYSFAEATNGSVRVDFIVIDQEVTQAGLPNMARLILGPMFRPERARPAPLMGTTGLSHAMPARPGDQTMLYVASDAARTYLFIVTGPTGALAAARADVTALLGGVPAPGAAADDGRGVGIRSIPGY